MRIRSVLHLPISSPVDMALVTCWSMITESLMGSKGPVASKGALLSRLLAIAVVGFTGLAMVVSGSGPGAGVIGSGTDFLMPRLLTLTGFLGGSAVGAGTGLMAGALATANPLGAGVATLAENVLLNLSAFAFRHGLALVLFELVAPLGLFLGFLLGERAGDALPVLNYNVLSIGWID